MRAGFGFFLALAALGACGGEPLQGRPPGPDPSSTGAVSTQPAYSNGCWEASLPAQPQPLLPLSDVATICADAAAATSWSYPPNPAGTNGDDRGTIVGRWAACGARLSNLPAHDAIEFGANGRWRLLAVDATGAFSPVADPGEVSGFYQLLGIGQMNLQGETPAGGIRTLHVSFAASLDALSFTTTPSGPFYARTAPSPLNGADNPPPTAAGPCSMVGDWDLQGSGAPTVFSFDAAGNFVWGRAATLCGSNSHGTYALSDGLFQLPTSFGLGCAWWYGATYSASFDPSCTQLSLTPVTDNCTGGRAVFNMPTTITRRAGPAVDAGI